MSANPTSPFLSERLIARLSRQQLANLDRRLRERAQDSWLAVQTGTIEDVPASKRAYAVLGRLSAMTA